MSLSWYLMFDASSPPATAPKGYNAVAGYIGGDTPHVWSKSEWGRFKGFKKLPVFVRSDPGAQSSTGTETDAFSVLASAYDLGIPRGTAIALDFEAATDQAYYDLFSNILYFFGYHTWLYGSASTVFKVRANNYWVADWTGKAFMYNHKGVAATQYENGTSYDSSTVTKLDYWFKLSRKWTKV